MGPTLIPSDITITRIQHASLEGIRPRVIGRNSRLSMHGQRVTDPIAHIETSAGISGWGWSRADEDAARELVGRRLHDVFDPQTGTRDPFLAFDFPVWDLVGQVLGTSAHALLGDDGPNPVPVYDGSIYIDELDPETGGTNDVRPMLDAVKMGMATGFRAFKVKVGRGHKWMEARAGVRRDIEVLRAIRDLIGPEQRLLIDANNGYTPAQAREVLSQVADCDIHWVEEPFPEDRDECVSLKRFIEQEGWSTLVADGEGSEPHDAAFTEIVRAGGIDVVQFDMRGYTLTKWLRYLPVLEETGALAAPHNWGSHLSGFYIAQFGRGCARFSAAETDQMVMPAVVAADYELVDGMRKVPDTPGFGLTLDPDVFGEALTRDDAWTVGE